MSTEITRTATVHAATVHAAAVRSGNAVARLARRLRPEHQNERGMATAEYAVGTVAAVALVTVLINVFRNAEFAEVLLNLVIAIFKAVLGTQGFGL